MRYYGKLCCDFCQTEINIKDHQDLIDEEHDVVLCKKCLKKYKSYLRLNEANIFCTPGEFNAVNDDLSAEYMLNVLNGFHDFCILEFCYKNKGIFPYDDGSVCEEFRKGEIRMLFCGTSIKGSPLFEVIFSNIAEYRLTYSCDYFSEISNVSMKCIRDNKSIKGESGRLILWCTGYDPDAALKGQDDDYILAESVKWRWLDSMEFRERVQHDIS